MGAPEEAGWSLLPSLPSPSLTAVSTGRFSIHFWKSKSYEDLKIDDHKETENSDILSCQRVEGNSDYGVNDSDDNNNDIFVSAS